MSLFYPAVDFGRFSFTCGLTPSLLCARYGLDCGERFHRDIAWRIAQVMEIDRLVHADFGGIGLGFREPFPRATIEPFGHRFVPAMLGCAVAYAPGEDPACIRRPLDAEEIRCMPDWTPERFAAAQPVRIVREQARWARAHCDREAAERRLGFNPHAQPLSALQNLGSVINTAVSVFGEDALVLALDDPDLLRAFYRNVTDLMLICLDELPRDDGRRLRTVFVGDCSVAMISPAQYRDADLEPDRRLCAWARDNGARFLVHQDSGATPHLADYAALGPVHAIDFGQDTDWEKAACVFPDAEASCILFPSWLRSHSREEIREELVRLMRAGCTFPRFSFSLLEIDADLAEGRIFEVHEEIRRAAEIVGRRDP
jgi:hypothetical protein